MVSRRDEVNASGRTRAGADLGERRLLDVAEGERQVVDIDDAVRSGGIRPDALVGIDVQREAGAPAGAARLVVAGQARHLEFAKQRAIGVNAAEADHRIGKHAPL